jgi:hypothetical protein
VAGNALFLNIAFDYDGFCLDAGVSEVLVYARETLYRELTSEHARSSSSTEKTLGGSEMAAQLPNKLCQWHLG